MERERGFEPPTLALARRTILNKNNDFAFYPAYLS